MENYGIILRRLRKMKNLTIRQAAALIGRSGGWLSEIENSCGLSRIADEEFDDLVTKLDGDQHRSSFGGWVRVEKQVEASSDKVSFDGPILKHLRTKAGFTLERAAAGLGISEGYLSKLENGSKVIHLEMRNKILELYDYRSSSFKNFQKDEGLTAVPVRLRINATLRWLREDRLLQVLEFITKLDE